MDWIVLSSNPNAIDILKNNLDNIDFNELSKNDNIMQIFPLDYDAMKERKEPRFLSNLLSYKGGLYFLSHGTGY